MRFVIGIGAVCVVGAVSGAVRPSGIFSDHMVLQRDRPVRVWGEADPGEHVKVMFAGHAAETTAGTNGEWLVELPACPMSCEGQTLECCGKTAVAIKDVLVGDVWLVSGQSNAEMTFGWGILNGAAERAAATNFPNIRAVRFEKLRAMTPQRAVKASPWCVCTAATLANVSAEGYFFARELNRETGVPIGILDNNWGGSQIEPYIPLEGYESAPGLEKQADIQRKRLADFDKYAIRRERYVSSMLRWAKYAEEQRKTGKPVEYWPSGVGGPDTTYCGQYNAMIAPIVAFPIAGATWYQGCSNGGEDESYAVKLKALARSWRKAWGYDFPFYVVQLSSFYPQVTTPEGGDKYARIRDAQRRAVAEIPGSGLAVTIDIGNAGDIHPKNKLDVGVRLSKWALRDVYGRRDLVVSGPLFKSVRYEGAEARVTFTSCGSGLFAGEKGPDTPGQLPTSASDGRLVGFAIAGADRKWAWADARIDGDTVVLTSPEVERPVAVRYGFRGNAMGLANLYNREGLPASPFRTDSWPCTF